MSRRKKISLAVLAVMAVLIGYGVQFYLKFSREMSAHYGTMNTIGNVTRYVETHDGRWPTNWDEIEPWRGARAFVVMQFDVDIERLCSEPVAIRAAITPAYGSYSEDHHGYFAEQLRQTLIKHRKPQAKPTAGVRR